MGGLGPMDVERKGSMDWGRGNKMIHPMQDSPRPATVPYFEARPNRRRSSWIIGLFVLLNTVVFIVAMFINDCPKDLGDSCTLRFLGRFSFQPLKENPLFGPSSSTLEKMGGLVWHKVVKEHQGWRLITCIWLHAGVFHLLANMLSLIFIGIRLEQEFGFVRIGIVYLVSAFGGSVLSALFNQNGVSVGASGALFGLLGAMLSELITNWTIYASKFAALVTLLFIIVVNLAFGLLPHVDNFAHIGGFVSGFLLGFVFLMRPQFGWVNRKHIPPGYDVNSVVNSKHNAYQYILGLLSLILLIVGYDFTSAYSKHNAYQYLLGLLSLILLIVGFTIGLVLLFHGVNANKHCSWCHYLDCVPSSRWTCNDGVIACEEVQSDTEFTLTCQNGGKSKIYPSQTISDAKKRQLCIQQCS